MTLSRQEEIISTLWIIASILCFGFGYNLWGKVILGKGLFDFGCSIFYAIKK